MGPLWTCCASIADVPGNPEGPLEVSDVHKEGCKLKWKRPKDTGGMPLDGYLVEKMDPETGVWVPVGKTKEPGKLWHSIFFRIFHNRRFLFTHLGTDIRLQFWQVRPWIQISTQ